MKAFAALVLFALLVVAAIVAALIVFSPTREELRDLVIIVYGVLGILFFLLMIAVGVGLLAAVAGVARAVRELIADPVRPTLNEARDTVHNIRGASEFIADAAVSPFIKVISVTRGIRRGLGVVTGVARRRR